MARLEAAEDRAFERYVNREGSAATARSAKSRVNRLDADLTSARFDVFQIIDQIDGGEKIVDIDGFVDEVLR
jgi:hypothetical protein